MSIIDEIRIAAGIVLFNPDNEERLNKSIASVLTQVDHLYIFDNSTKKNNLKFSSAITYITENSNNGVAYALNRIMEKAKDDGFEWVVTMDQDSILPANTIKLYKKYAGEKKNIAIICPQVIDSRRSYMKVKKKPQKEYIDFCITSASCTNLSAWEKVGAFDEWLFIDLVDNEFCKRLIVSGYKILRLNNLILDQEFGKIIPKSEKTQRFWNFVAQKLHNDNFAKFGYRKFVSPLRVYYTNRNIIYVNRKLRQYGKTGYENYNCKGYLGFIIAFTIPSFLRADAKCGIIKAIVKGVYDGVISKPVAWQPDSLSINRM